MNAAETTEEQLLAALLGANEELLEAIKMYEDLERAGEELQKHEREIQERKVHAFFLDLLLNRNSFRYMTILPISWIPHVSSSTKRLFALRFYDTSQ